MQNLWKRIFLFLVFMCFFLMVESQKPEAFYINMEKSVHRRKAMEEYLEKYGLSYYRIPGVTAIDMFIPDDVKRKWDSAYCQVRTNWEAPDERAGNLTFNDKHILTAFPKKYYVRGLCGSKVNTLNELAVVYSHLLAIRRAVYSETAKSRYALILEDDVVSPFDVDFEEMANAVFSTAGDFGILQLFNSKPVALAEMYERYRKDNNFLFQKRPAAFDGRYLPTWSTGAYVINRIAMKPVIDTLLAVDEKTGWVGATILSGTTHPVCKPAYCCDMETNTFKEPTLPGCVYAPVGYAADSFIYAAADTFTISIPLFASNDQGYLSTMHQSQALSHHKAFRRIATYIKELMCGISPLPPFVRLSETGAKDINITIACDLK